MLGTLLALTVVAAACGASSQSSSTGSAADSIAADDGPPVDGGGLVVGINSDTAGWNPALAPWADAGSLVGSSVLEPLASVGEDTGALDTMLAKIAEFYDQEVEATTESLTALIEPLMIAFLGGVVGSMIIALYMPIFKIFELIK